MENLKKEMLVGECYFMDDFFGDKHIITECPHCKTLISYNRVEKEALGHFLADGEDVESYSCLCSVCKEEYYLYL